MRNGCGVIVFITSEVMETITSGRHAVKRLCFAESRLFHEDLHDRNTTKPIPNPYAKKSNAMDLGGRYLRAAFICCRATIFPIEQVRKPSIAQQRRRMK